MTEASSESDKNIEPDPIKKISLIVIAIIAALLIWAVLADRYTPFSSEARVRGYVVPIAPKVPGTIESINVNYSQLVEGGDVLLQLERDEYQLAVEKAQAELEQAGQAIGAATASVAGAETALADANAELSFAKRQAARVFELEKKGVISQVDGDKVRTKLQQAKLTVANASARLEKEKQNLGSAGSDNPRIRQALSALQAAQLDLNNTTIRAPSKGGVTNVTTDIGYYATVGKPVMTFVSTKAVWVDAYMRENCLGNIDAGDDVELVLDVAPGQVFKGKVIGTSFGVNWGQSLAAGDLPTITTSSGWLRDAQRFPVAVQFNDESAYGLRRIGGQADVVIYSTDNIIMNTLAALHIRLVSLLSYFH